MRWWLFNSHVNESWVLNKSIVIHYTWDVNFQMRYEGHVPKYFVWFLLRINRMVAMVTNQLSLHLAAECARLIGGWHCSSGNVNYLACGRLTTHAISCDVCQTQVRSKRILSQSSLVDDSVSDMLLLLVYWLKWDVNQCDSSVTAVWQQCDSSATACLLS